MKIADLDYYAIYGNSWLHKIPAKYKLIVVFLILVTVIFVYNYALIGLSYLLLLLIILSSNVPKFKIILLSMYPLLFIAIYIFSIKNLTYDFTILLVFKVLLSATAFILLVFTTTYMEIFKKLDRILPSSLVSILFITYRSIFILWKIFENIQLTMHLRGGIRFSRPIYSLKLIGSAFGNMIIRSIEVSENIYDCMIIRGYTNNLRYLRK